MNIQYPSTKGVSVIKGTTTKIKPDTVCIVQKDVYKTGKFSIHLTNKNYKQQMTYDAVIGVTSSKQAANIFCDEFKKINNLLESKLENYVRKIIRQVIKEQKLK